MKAFLEEMYCCICDKGDTEINKIIWEALIYGYFVNFRCILAFLTSV